MDYFKDVKEDKRPTIKKEPIFNNYHFYQWKNNIFRKGFIYKHFTLLQIDSQNVKPMAEEREQFLQTYNANLNEDNNSSDEENPPEKTRAFFKKDSAADLAIGDKIYIVSGELQTVIGVVTSKIDGGSTV